MFKILTGKCEEVLPTLDSESFDASFCDPPYGLGFSLADGWDHGVPDKDVWSQVLRALRPGAFLLAFGGTRVYHRLASAIEDGGFNIKDCLGFAHSPDWASFLSSLDECQIQAFLNLVSTGFLEWVYSSGYPKAHDLSKYFDKHAGVKREVVGKYQPPGMDGEWNLHNAKDERAVEIFASSRNNLDITAPATDNAKRWDGYKTALKPAWEPVVLGQKTIEGKYIDNASKHGVGALNISAARIPVPDRLGRFPSNVLLDASAAEQIDAQTGVLKSGMMAAGQKRNKSEGQGGYQGGFRGFASRGGTYGDEGGASRFYYCAKASSREKSAGLPEGMINNHPTVKPIDLCRYLASLILPPPREDGQPRRILVNYSGSGSEMIGCLLAGWDEVVGIEKNSDFVDIAMHRLYYWESSMKKVAKSELDDLFNQNGDIK